MDLRLLEPTLTSVEKETSLSSYATTPNLRVQNEHVFFFYWH
ncbi:uncharacterized protein G2W53_027051 [Senna tora]|uniref:Uncharacterized protein n=1 Tax=Senna tora TaxID=362788 RepID=A0A834TI70_9FABA|nr:uncharacterized protein G2W53_027051 [Senna tora]